MVKLETHYRELAGADVLTLTSSSRFPPRTNLYGGTPLSLLTIVYPFPRLKDRSCHNAETTGKKYAVDCHVVSLSCRRFSSPENSETLRSCVFSSYAALGRFPEIGTLKPSNPNRVLFRCGGLINLTFALGVSSISAHVIHHTSYLLHRMPFLFVPVTSRGSLSKAVGSQIKEAIRSKLLTPGDRLPSELELCKQFQVSRTAVREALRALSAQGLIAIVKGKGIFARDVSAETVTGPIHLYLQLQGGRNYALDVIQARQIIEPPIAGSAALHHTKEDAERLKKDLDDLTISQGDNAELSRLDMNFHLDIARASENSLIPLLLEPIHQLMPLIKSRVYAAGKDSRELAVTWHRKILDAILRRDAEGARQAMTRHLQIAEDQIEQMLEHVARGKTLSRAVRSENKSEKQKV